MNLNQAIKLALRGILDNKMRSLLTMLGIIIGVGSVITLVAIGQGTTAQVTEQIQSLGSNLLTINITGRGVNTSLSYDQVMKFAESANVKAVAPVVSAPASVKYGNKMPDDLQVTGTNDYYHTVRNYNIASGRFFVSSDIDMRKKVAVIGSQAAQELFGLLDPLGENIKVGNQFFKVIGVLESKGSTMMGSSDTQVLIPITVAERLAQARGIRTIYVQAKDPNTVSLASDEISSMLLKMFGNDQNSFRIFDQTQVLDTVNKTADTLAMMLGGIAGISLLVGGIGIMNIMLVSVTERTREIGIRKALGAKRRDILFQFLIEALVISGLGGITGIVLGILLSNGLADLLHIGVKVSLPVVGVSFVFSLLVGMFFGIHPAHKASGLSPMTALRYE